MSMSKGRSLLPALLALALVACEEVPLTAPLGATMFLQANPTFVPANGGVSIVTAVLTEPAGTLVNDGTVVNFFTNLGRIDPEAKTRNGIARVNFVADGRSGTATITAISGSIGADGSANITIDIGSALPRQVVVTADPPRISGSRTSLIVANVFDEFGNPVANVPVIFTVSTTGTVPLEESLDSGGRPQFTDTNGQAFDVLRTRAAIGAVQKRVTVTATPPVGSPGDVTVFVN
jgi:hypothetical protein